MRRKRLMVAVLGLTLLIPFASPVKASVGWSEETFYYNYGSQWPDGAEGYDCAPIHYSYGDRTPSNGELKAVVRTNCDTWEQEVTWYRYNDPGCTTPVWHWIPEPTYYRYVQC